MAAADALSGRSVWLGIGKQTAVGVPAAPTKYFEVTDLSGILPEYEYKKSDRRVGSRFKALGYKSAKRVPLSFTVEANAQNAGLLLTLAMGDDDVSASGSAYLHTISLTEDLPYFTAVISTADTADSTTDATVHQIVNCKVSSMKIDGTVDDVLKIGIEATGTDRNVGYASETGLSVTLTASDATVTVASTAGLIAGQSITGTGIPTSTTILSVTNATTFEMSANATASGAQTAAVSITPTFPTAKSLYAKAEEGQAKLEIGAAIVSLAQFDEATEFHLTISNGVEADRRIDNTAEAYGMREGDSEITGSLKAMYNANTLEEVEAFQDGDTRAIAFTATSAEEAATGSPFSLAFTADLARYSGAPASFDPDVISTDLQFEVQKSTDYPVIEIVNADSSAY